MPPTIHLVAASLAAIGVIALLYASVRGDTDDKPVSPEEQAKAAGEAAGETLAQPFLLFGKFLGNIARGYVKQLGKALKIDRLWKWMIKAGYRGYLQSTGADQIGHIVDQNRIRHLPLYWDDDRGQWVDEPGSDEPNFWNAANEGSSQYLAFNSIPTCFATGDATEMGDHLQAEVAEAFDAGTPKALFRNAQVQHVQVEGDTSAAVADGGVQQYTSNVSVQSPGVLEDVLVPLEGQRVISLEKYQQTYPEVVDSEEMQNQETRGRLMERDKDAHKLLMKYAMYLFFGAVLLILGIILGPQLLGGGGGGGGGGSIIPFFLGGGLI